MTPRIKLIITAIALAVVAWVVCFGQRAGARAELEQKWHEQVYALDDDEVVRVVPPPYPPGENLVWESRIRRFANTSRTGLNGATLRQWGLYVGSINGLTRADLDWEETLSAAKVVGIWIARKNAPVERRMKALESIASSVTALPLRIEKRMMERDVIVVRGNWMYTPVGGHRDKVERAVHLYTSKLDPAERGFGKFADLLHRVEEIAQRKVVDEASERPKDVEWWESYSEWDAPKSEAALEQLLANLSKQTGLEFEWTKRVIPVWIMEDNAATTRPGGGQ